MIDPSARSLPPPSGFVPRSAGAPPRVWSAFNPVTVILVCAIGLTFLGLTILFSASASFKQGPYYYLNKQVAGVAMAAVLCWVTSRLNLDYVRRYAWWIGGALILGLVLVLIPHLGITVKGSRRWLGFGPLRLQVSEFAKLGMVFCLAHYLALNQTRIGELKRGYLAPLGLVGAFAVLIAKEPDLGTAALVITVGLVMLFLAGARWRYILPTIAAVLGGFALLVKLMPNRLARFSMSRATRTAAPISSTSRSPPSPRAGPMASAWGRGGSSSISCRKRTPT